MWSTAIILVMTLPKNLGLLAGVVNLPHTYEREWPSVPFTNGKGLNQLPEMTSKSPFKKCGVSSQMNHVANPSLKASAEHCYD
jgi:hypothetical protein